MDLLDLLILALRIVLVALLYVFLVVVMRTAARGLRTVPRVAPTPVALQLVVVEPGVAAPRRLPGWLARHAGWARPPISSA